MKKITLSLIATLFAINFSYAQNTFPSSGNVGIGTTSPGTTLSILGSGYKDVLITGSGTVGAGLTFNSTGTGGRQYTLLSTASSAGASAGKFSIFDETSQIYRLVVDAGGNIGIGTTSPNGVFHINNNVGYVDNAANQLMLTNSGYRSSESGTLPADNAAMTYYFTNYNAGGRPFDRTLDIRVRGTADGTYGASMIRFFANDYTNGSAEREIMRIHGNGSVLIGKTVQVNTAYKLDVAGSVRANEIVVNTDGADFVFEPTYKLPSISSLKKYIDKNHHLPEIPSAKQMQEDGLSVGENQVKLLQKVEELTLYLIEKDKQLKTQQEQIDALVLKVNALTKPTSK